MSHSKIHFMDDLIKPKHYGINLPLQLKYLLTSQTHHENFKERKMLPPYISTLKSNSQLNTVA